MRRTIAVSLFILFAASVGAAALESLTVCSFDINQLGYYAEKDGRALAHVLANYDVVVIQGIVAPPYEGTFPNGDPYQPNDKVGEFFDEMTIRHGFGYGHRCESGPESPVRRRPVRAKGRSRLRLRSAGDRPGLGSRRRLESVRRADRDRVR